MRSDRPHGGRHEAERPPRPGAFYWTLHAMPRRVWPLFGGLHAEGVEHIPADGPFLLISNHQSLLDPFLIQSLVPRPCHAMAKSTQFAARLAGAIMKRCYAFPVRRFQVDPQAVRIALRRLEAGCPVHIYIEGERTWDGSLQPPRPGTLRLALRAGVPVVPCGISGAYEAWPRWASRPRRADVRVAFGAPIHLPRVRSRAEREAALPAAAGSIMGAIAALVGAEHEVSKWQSNAQAHWRSSTETADP